MIVQSAIREAHLSECRRMFQYKLVSAGVAGVENQKLIQALSKLDGREVSMQAL